MYGHGEWWSDCRRNVIIGYQAGSVMNNGGDRNRVLCKLERIVNHSLSGIRPRLCNVLGIGPLENHWLRGGDDLAKTEERRTRIAGMPIGEITPRVREELGL